MERLRTRRGPECSGRLHPRFVLHSWQVIPDHHPFGSIIEEYVYLGVSVDLAVQISQRKMILLWIVGRLENQRAPASFAEAPLAVLRGLVGNKALLTGHYSELRFWHANPRYIAGAVTATAHRAVAVGAEVGRQGDLELNLSAKTRPANRG